jgi:Zn-dependent protease with chaperone function
MKSLAAKLRLLAVLFVLPLGLLIWSSFQGWRVDWTLDDNALQHQLIAQLQADPQHIPPMPSRFKVNREPAEVLLARFIHETSLVDGDRSALHLRGFIAGVGQLLALASMLLTVGTWLSLRYAGLRARASRDYLLEQLPRWWQRLGTLAQLQTLLMVLSSASVALYEASLTHSHWDNGGQIMLLVSLPAWLLLSSGIYLLRRLRLQLQPLPAPGLYLLGRLLPAELAPGLWGWVNAISERISGPMPDHVVVGVDQGFFVTEVPVTLQPSGQRLTGRTLYMPLTYCSVLSQPEAATIIGHELGHFANADTARGSRLGPFWEQMRQRFAELAEHHAQDPSRLNLPVLWLHGLFIDVFDTAYYHWSRRQELAADRIGAQVSDERVFAQALLRVTALGDLIAAQLAGPHQGNLVRALTDYLERHPLQLGEDQLDHTLTHPFDSHPPTAARICSLDVKLDDTLLAQATRWPSAEDRHWFSALLAAPTPASHPQETL